MQFLTFWEKLNVALAIRGEPEALYGEARAWYRERVVPAVDDRMVNQVINHRKPL
jgi:hypothetical protein